MVYFCEYLINLGEVMVFLDDFRICSGELVICSGLHSAPGVGDNGWWSRLLVME